MQKGISTARNPSSALMARIRDAEKEMTGRGAARRQPERSRDEDPLPSRHPARDHDGHSRAYAAPEISCSVPQRLLGDLQEFLRASVRGQHGNWAADLLRHLEDINGSSSPAPFRFGDDHHGARERSPRHHRREADRSRHDRYPDPFQDKMEAFLRANPVDDKAADALRQCDPRLAQVVMDKGISTARNPSSALLARIRDEGRRDERPPVRDDRDRGDHRHHAEPRDEHRSRGRGGSRLEDEVRAWLGDANVDDRAAEALLLCSPDVQQVVMEKGVSGARNPSSALLARIRNCSGGGAPRSSPY